MDSTPPTPPRRADGDGDDLDAAPGADLDAAPGADLDAAPGADPAVAPDLGPDADHGAGPTPSDPDGSGSRRTRRARLQLLGFVGVALVVLLAAFGGRSGEEAPAAADAPVAVADGGDACAAVSSTVAFDRSTGLGALPVASFADLAEPDTLVCTSDWEGTPTVVNFWATWCPFCVEEMPDLQSASETLEGRVQFVGIDVQDNRDDALAFLATTGVTYDQVHSPAGAFYTELGNRGMPTTLFVTADGTIAWRHTGPLTEQQVLALVEQHLGVEA